MNRVIFAAFAVLYLTGCATAIKGRSQTIPVASEPDGADIIVNDSNVGVTPAEVELRRKRDHQIIIKKQGYKPVTIPVLKSVGGAVWGNILAGGFIGWGVDASTGAQYNLKPETISVTLKRLEEGEVAADGDAETASGIRKLRELDQALEDKLISKEEYGKARERVIKEFFPEMLEEEES